MKKPFSFDYKGITGEQFSEFSEHYNEGSEHHLNIDMGFLYSASNRVVSCRVTSTYSENDKTYLECTITCSFEVASDSWMSRTNKVENTVLLENEAYEYFGAFTIGTLRGYLHAKQSNTIAKAYLPPINVVDIVERIENKTILLS